ncbi:hypothetical protein [Salininema proteolyticum]|uniref:Uncharacterized protein n=1 Tax=Salininema proteolyticum TaxID=1607685 RepID=A0ABV8TXT9_9ACTN
MIDDAVTGGEITSLQASFKIAVETARDHLIRAENILDEKTIDLKGRIGAALLASPLPKRRLQTAPRVVKRTISKHRAKGQVQRKTYQATLEIALIDTRYGNGMDPGP